MTTYVYHVFFDHVNTNGMLIYTYLLLSCLHAYHAYICIWEPVVEVKPPCIWGRCINVNIQDLACFHGNEQLHYFSGTDIRPLPLYHCSIAVEQCSCLYSKLNLKLHTALHLVLKIYVGYFTVNKDAVGIWRDFIILQYDWKNLQR